MDQINLEGGGFFFNIYRVKADRKCKIWLKENLFRTPCVIVL
jgi:hypothetical protein